MVGVYGFVLHRTVLTGASLDVTGMFVPLHLVLYPIGFLPETVAGFAENPVLGYVWAAGWIFFIAFVCWRVRHTGLYFAVLGAGAMRLFQGEDGIDLVYLDGGGGLLVPVALLSVGAVAFCQRVMDHPKWRYPMIYLSTATCLLLFVLQISTILDWHRGGAAVHRLHIEGHIDDAFDPMAFGTAPVDLDAAVRHTTPFSDGDASAYL
jgi:hypothetical protein